MQKSSSALRRQALLLLAALTPILLIFAIVYKVHDRALNDAMQRELVLIRNFYYGYEAYEADEIRSIVHLLMEDEDLGEAFRQKDRAALLKQGEHLYRDLHDSRGITHLYFTGPDRVNFLRLHNPERFGDTINRASQLAAEKSSEDAWGLELGPFGTFTLRVVAPWFKGKELIGYLEAGKEVEHIAGMLNRLLGVKAYVFIYKEFIERGGWEQGMEMLSREGVWDRFRQSVNIGEDLGDLPDEIARFMADKTSEETYRTFEMNERIYQARFIPLLDVRNIEVGRIGVLLDITDLAAGFRRNLLLSAGPLLILWGIVILVMGRRGRETQQPISD